jgi:hypothetical protein
LGGRNIKTEIKEEIEDVKEEIEVMTDSSDDGVHVMSTFNYSNLFFQKWTWEIQAIFQKAGLKQQRMVEPYSKLADLTG